MVERTPRRAWTPEELATLQEWYPQGGTRAVMAHLPPPGRSFGAVRGAAEQRELAIHGRQPRARVPTTPHIDQAIRVAYETGRRGAVKALARRIDRPYSWVRYRAVVLGCRPILKRMPAWSAEEDALLEATAGRSLKYIAGALRKQGFSRSEAAIQTRLYDLAVDTHDPDLYTVSSIARYLGADRRAVVGWIEKGWLKAKREARIGLMPAAERQRWIQRRHLRDFLIAYPTEWHCRKVRDTVWLVDILAGRVGRIERRPTPQEAAADV